MQNVSNSTTKYCSSKSKASGIDVVLGGQWGDEGKGKLVDMLSQVSFFAKGMCVEHAGTAQRGSS